MTEPLVLLAEQESVAIVTLNAPGRRNVLSAELVSALGRAFDELEASGARCAVLTGAGSAFCAGAELNTLEQAAGGDFGPVRDVYDGFLRVLASPVPTIAAVNGPALGAGFNLALACDVRLAAPTARFDTRFAALNLHPGGGHTWLLNRSVGPQQAMLACLFGQVWNADAALERGLVAAVHPVDDLMPAAVELGGRLRAQSPEYVRTLTATLRQAASGARYEDVLASEIAAQRWSLSEPAFLRGLEAIRAQIARR